MPVEATGKAAGAAIEAMKSTPLAIALLVVNVGFLGFAAYLLGEVASNSAERNKSQIELISKLVTDIRDCRQGPKPTDFLFKFSGNGFDRTSGD
jgi:Tfp pilus assembly protein PilV